MYNKKALSAIIATCLLLVVTIFVIIAFKTWYANYSSSVFSDIENRDSSASLSSNIQGLYGEQAYFKNSFDENITVT